MKKNKVKKEDLIVNLLRIHPEMVLEELFGIPGIRTPGFNQSGAPVIETVEDVIHFTGLKEEKVLTRFERYLMTEKDIELSCQELSEILASDCDFVLLDVREQWEFDTAKIAGSVRLGDLNFEEWFVKVKKSGQNIVTICHHGVRSLSAAVYLRQQGIVAVKSLKGGVDQWATDIDPAMPRY